MDDGDDDLAPVASAPARLQRDVRALLSGDPATAQAGVAELATGGTGLGLAIARQLALAMDAVLSLHNRPGGGLEARLLLKSLN